MAEARERLVALLKHPAAARRGLVHTELGLVLERLGDPDGAFEAASRGQRLRFEDLPPDERDPAVHETVISGALSLTRGQVASWAAPAEASAGRPGPLGASPAPVFVVGFPRSGTTLIEQMLAAHPRLVVTDELPHLQSVRQKMYAAFQPGRPYPGALGGFTGAQVSNAKRWYLDRVSKALAPSPDGQDASMAGRRVVDKQPLNTVEMCMARLLFPESQVIYVQRDPRDTVLSVFMQGFAGGMPHLFSLEGTARLYDLFARVWRHYLEILGQSALTVRYEDVVAEPEREARRIIDFIGERWDPAVLNFHAPEHRRYVTTPSYADVSQPVYKRAVGRWRRYRVQLAPVLGVLDPWVEAGGYPSG